MDFSPLFALIMGAAVEMTGLSVPVEPSVAIIPQSELVKNLCVEGKEAQCAKIKTFSPPFSNEIYISQDLNLNSPFDRAIVFHEFVKYTLFVNGKQVPTKSCQENFWLEGKIYRLQMKYMTIELENAAATGSYKYSEEDIMNLDKGSYRTWCDPQATPPEPKQPRILNEDEIQELNKELRNGTGADI